MENNRKPKNYWTFEKILEEALKHNYRCDFSKASYQAYDKARVNGWLDIVCAHMPLKTNPPNYWTKIKCAEEALKYKNRTDFKKESQVAYNKAKIKGWLDELCSHMSVKNKPKGYWTKERCREEAVKYESINDFKDNASYVYKISCKNNWLDEITHHINKLENWNFEKCKTTALKFNILEEFRKKESGCYSAICKNKWGDLLCSHMKRKCSKKLFLNKSLCREVALQYKNRKDFRKECRNIYIFICKNNWLEELCSHQECKKRNGYWTKEECHKKALECKTNSEFSNKYPSAYQASLKNKWLGDIRGHFEISGNISKRFIYAYEFPDNKVYVGLTWNIEKRKQQHLEKGTVFEYFIKTNLKPSFKQISLFPIEAEEAKKQEGYYLDKYIKEGWVALNKTSTGALGKIKIKWTIDKLQEEALKYTSKKDFREYSSSAYTIAKSKKILNYICKHMNYKERKPSNYWTYENCKKEVLKYNNKKDFYTISHSAYGASIRNGWIEELYKEAGF